VAGAGHPGDQPGAAGSGGAGAGRSAGPDPDPEEAAAAVAQPSEGGPVAAATTGGHAGLILDRPDAPLALGLLGAGFSEACRGAFLRHLRRDYGSQLDAIDFQKLAGEALATASGAVTYDQLHFGRDFWRFRHEALPETVASVVLRVRDAARAARRPAAIAARFEEVGPAQLAASRHLDAVVLPLRPPPHHTGVAAGRLWRAVLGYRGAAAQLPAEASPAGAAALAAALAVSGVGVAFEEGERATAVAPVRRLLREHLERRSGVAFSDAVADVALLYSPEADLWSRGVHRAALEEAGETLSRAHVQWTVTLSTRSLRPPTVLVLAQASALAPGEAAGVKRFLEAGGAVLAFGEPGQVDAGGRPLGPFLPAGAASGTRIGGGMLASLPPLVASGTAPPGPSPLEPILRAVETLRRRSHRAAEITAPSAVLTALWRSPKRLDVHLVSLSPEPVRGATLFLDEELSGSARRARFRAASGVDEKFALHPMSRSVSATLPPFRGYAVLSLVP
jgi:hypothetical protein